MGVITELEYLFVISLHFWVISFGQCTEWGFWGVLKFQICIGSGGMPGIPDMF